MPGALNEETLKYFLEGLITKKWKKDLFYIPKRIYIIGNTNRLYGYKI
jgi:hypothetical protein